MRFKVTISYDGSSYHGFQKQINYPSIENEIEIALEKMHKKKIKVFGAGRTDKGVHAYGQVFHFDTELNIDEKGVKKGLNALLPSDIYVKSVEKVGEDFHARYSCTSKIYLYKINLGEYNPIESDYIYQLNKEVDLLKMKEASNLFIGEHNFYNFCGYQEDKIKNYIRVIDYIEFTRENNYLYIRIKGNGFIRYMVRMIVAILLEIGLNRKDELYIKERLDSDIKKRSNYKVSGLGLYLESIIY